MASPIAATGLGSNLDVSGLVSKLMEVESRPLTKLDSREAATQVKISALGSFRSSLSAFQGTLKSLNEPSNYSVTKATIDDAAIASVTSNATAAAGSYSLEVQNLAKAQKISSKAYAATSEVLGTGKLTIQFGSYDAGGNTFTPNSGKATQSLTIDAAHSSLSGVRDAINAAKIGVTASIVNDGTGNRLVISSKDTGAANSVKITVSDDSGGGDNLDATGLSALAYDPTLSAGAGKNMTQNMAAEDARLLVDGLLVTKSSNTISDVLAGVTLNLTKPSAAGVATKLSVAADTNVATTAVDNFVKAYNELNKTITDLTKYDAEANKAAALQGDAAIRAVATEIRNGLTGLVSGALGDYKALPQIGLSFDRSGNLQVDKAKLQNALKADATAVQSLFASAGLTSDPLVSYAGGTNNTKAGTYEVNVTQLATRGSIRGNAAAGLTIDASNNTLNLSVNGTATAITLNQGTYASHAALIAELQSQINANGTLVAAGASVSVSESGGTLTLTSQRYGSGSSVAITGGSAADYLFGNAPAPTAGSDVAGTINGAPAGASGQRLTGIGAADGLKLDVTGGATGPRGTVRYGVGIAGKLDQMLTKLLDSKGLIAAKTTSLQDQVEAIDSERTRLRERLEATEARLTKQFNSLDQQLSNMQSMGSYLAQQLAAISKQTG